jgi:hypothetical protein
VGIGQGSRVPGHQHAVDLHAGGIGRDDVAPQFARAGRQIDAEDRGVIGAQRGHGARLLLEAGQGIGATDSAFGQDLDRDVAAQLRITGAVDFAHAALAEQSGDFVVRQAFSDHVATSSGGVFFSTAGRPARPGSNGSGRVLDPKPR